jgi:hypothetical protein
MKKIEIRGVSGQDMFDPCELYNRKLDHMEKKIVGFVKKKHRIIRNPGTIQKWYNEQHHLYKNNVGYKTLIEKLQRDLCIIIPSHKYHRMWNNACVESLKDLDYFKILAWDNQFYKDKLDIRQYMPTPEVLSKVDSIVMKPKTFRGGVGVPHTWNMVFVLNQAYSLGFEYVFNINGDCFLENPENFEKARDIMGDADLFTCEWNHKRKAGGTMGFIAKTEHMYNCWRYILEHSYSEGGNSEARVYRYYMQNKLKVIPSHKDNWSYRKPFPGTTWYDLLGFRHPHAEHKVRRWEKMEPIERKYVDETLLNPREKQTLQRYWDTGNKKYLKQWWGN